MTGQGPAPVTFTGVTQTILHDDPEGRTGNCLQAALATLLNLPLMSVPHFAEHEDWLKRMTSWCRLYNYEVFWRPADVVVDMGIAVGPSPRGVKHAVVVLDGLMVWDPHPSRDGLWTVFGIYELVPSRRGE